MQVFESGLPFLALFVVIGEQAVEFGKRFGVDFLNCSGDQ